MVTITGIFSTFGCTFCRIFMKLEYCEVRNRGSYKTHRYRKYIPTKLDSLLMSIPLNDNIKVRILGYPLNVI